MKLMLLISAFFAFTQAEAVVYKVTLTSNWNRTDHLAVPGNAHFSPVVAASHVGDYFLGLNEDKTITPGMVPLAEFGQNRRINTEIRSAKSSGLVGVNVETKNQFVLRQKIQTFLIDVTEDHPYLSLVSMIAPSPDWLIYGRVRLYDSVMGFTSKHTGALYAIDGGTRAADQGGNFSLGGTSESPQKPISRLTGRGFNTPFATYTVELLEAE